MKKRTLTILAITTLLTTQFACGQDRTNTTPGGSSAPNPSIPQATPPTPVPTPTPAPQTPQQSQENAVLYYPDDQMLALYKETQPITYQSKSELPTKALQAWLKGPKSDKLTPLVPSTVTVDYVKDLGDGRVEVSFSKELQGANFGSTGESMFATAVPLILSHYGYTSVAIVVEGKTLETLAGHMTFNRPFKPENPSDYKWMDPK